MNLLAVVLIDDICVDLQSYKLKSTLREVQQKFVKNEVRPRQACGCL